MEEGALESVPFRSNRISSNHTQTKETAIAGNDGPYPPFCMTLFTYSLVAVAEFSN